MRREKGMTVKIDESKCTGCGLCVDACPVGAIIVDAVARIDAGLCRSCGVCIDECPSEAIYAEKKNTAAPFEISALPQSSRIPATQAARQFLSSEGSNQPSDPRPAKQNSGLLEQFFNFIGGTAITGRGHGSGSRQGLGQGRGCGRGKGGGGRGQGRNR